MSISVDADIRQLEMLRWDACLLQELDCAPVIRRVVRRFGRHDQDGHVGEIDELSRCGGIGLDYAVGVQRRVRRDNVLHEVARIGHGGQVGNGDIGKPVGACGRVTEDGVLEGRAGGFDRDDGVDEIRAHIRNEPGHRSTLGVGEEDDGGSNGVEQGGAGGLHGRLLVGC